ncbi:MAG: DUF1800 family protein [Hyphomonas sp.]|tara:strand:- start:4884 stop:6650 length:1767 start_codon:yes stop_codon:yes gene_type:complete
MSKSARKHVQTIAASFVLASAMTACGGGGGDGGTGGGITVPGSPPGSPPPPPPPPSPPPPSGPYETRVDDEAEAQRVLARGTFGGDLEDIQALVGADVENWVKAEVGKPATQYLQPLLALQSSGVNIDDVRHRGLFWDNMIGANDQLRTRMVFALSQLFVISDIDMYGQTPQVGYFLDVLSSNAFGNYRDLLEDVTYSSAMSRYLTYWRNEPGDPATGRMPDENYAREIMQLFSIGVIELNQDGTPKLTNGQQVETFNNDDVEGLARVFTGFSWPGASFYSGVEDDNDKRLVVFDEFHSGLEKRFLGTVIPPNTGGDESVRIALDTIFEHPNVAPFISRQLIQRFTASSPSPDYVKRVADVFDAGIYTANNGTVFGTGERGDLEATIAAVLLDRSVHGSSALTDTQNGKIREPVLKFINWVRAFDVQDINSNEEYLLRVASSPVESLGQQPIHSPSVFNFYRPGYVAPGTETGALGLTAPEFQIVNEGSIVGYMNMLTRFIFDDSPTTNGGVSFTPDYTREIALADDPSALVDYLDLVMTGNTMTAEVKADILEAVTALPSSSQADLERRVQLAAFMTISSPAYAIQR